MAPVGVDNKQLVTVVRKTTMVKVVVVTQKEPKGIKTVHCSDKAKA